MGVEDLLGLLVQPVLAGIAIVIILVVIRRRKAALDDQHGLMEPEGLGHDAGRDLVVEVRRLWITASFLGEHSNMSPRLWVAPDRLRFKVIRKIQELRFAAIREVHVATPLLTGGIRIFLRQTHWSGLRLPNYGLIVEVSGMGAARALLRALPRTVPVTQAAARLRDH